MFPFLTTHVTLISHWAGRKIRMYLVYCASHQFKLCFSLTSWDIRHLLLSNCVLFFCFFCLFVFFFASKVLIVLVFCFLFLIVLAICLVPMPFYWWILKGNASFLRVHNHVSPSEKNSPLYYRLSLFFIITYNCPVPHLNNKNSKNGWHCPLKRFKCLKCICTKYCW